jgi:type I restriction enzyme, R subunit
VYSQRFQREDFGEDMPFDPKVLPNEYLTNPMAAHTFVYVSTIQRMARNLFGAEGSYWAKHYDYEANDDEKKIVPIARALKRRGYLTKKEFLTVCRDGSLA